MSDRRAITLVYDAEEYLYPLAVFESQEDADAVRQLVIASVLEARRLAHERDYADDGDLPFNEQNERDWITDHIKTDAWPDVRLVLAGETVADILPMVRTSLAEYLSPEDDIWEALR